MLFLQFCRRENWGLERLCEFPKVTQLESGRAGTLTPKSNTHSLLCKWATPVLNNFSGFLINSGIFIAWWSSWAKAEGRWLKTHPVPLVSSPAKGQSCFHLGIQFTQSNQYECGGRWTHVLPMHLHLPQCSDSLPWLFWTHSNEVCLRLLVLIKGLF